jgi:acetyl-CoA carboxylase biotin carboxyl carrier protein
VSDEQATGHGQATGQEQPTEGLSDEARELLELIDRLEGLLERSELTELEVEAGGTALILRTPAAISSQAGGSNPGHAGHAGHAGHGAEPAPATEPAQTSSRHHAVLAPLTGLYYTSPSPGAEPYIRQGASVQVGQVIGLIEAMKLFNEIKSDVSGKITRICVESGALVKAKQPLIEVEPA